MQTNVNTIDVAGRPQAIDHALFEGFKHLRRQRPARRRPRRKNRYRHKFAVAVTRRIDKSSKLGARVELKTTCERPAPLPLGLNEGELPE